MRPMAQKVTIILMLAVRMYVPISLGLCTYICVCVCVCVFVCVCMCIYIYIYIYIHICFLHTLKYYQFDSTESVWTFLYRSVFLLIYIYFFILLLGKSIFFIYLFNYKPHKTTPTPPSPNRYLNFANRCVILLHILALFYPRPKNYYPMSWIIILYYYTFNWNK